MRIHRAGTGTAAQLFHESAWELTGPAKLLGVGLVTDCTSDRGQFLYAPWLQ